MTDLMRDLERYGRELDATGPMISIDDVQSRHATGGAVQRRVRPVPAWVVVAATAAAVLFFVGGLSLVFGGSEGSIQPAATTVPSTMSDLDETSATTTTPSAPADPEGVFEWGNPLSEWVTEDEMTALLQDLSLRFYSDTAGGDLGGQAVMSSPGGDLIWSVGYWSVGVHAGNGWHPTPTRTDPELPEGMTYEPISQSYVFSGTNSTESICITLTTPGTTASINEEPNYEQIFFEVATMLLEEMGWTD